MQPTWAYSAHAYLWVSKKGLAIFERIIILILQAPLTHEDREFGLSFHDTRLSTNSWCDILGAGTSGGEGVNIWVDGEIGTCFVESGPVFLTLEAVLKHQRSAFVDRCDLG